MNEPFAVIATYQDLRAAIATRRKELGLSQLAVDEIAGLQSGYTAKLEVGIKNFGEMSLSAILGALGLVLAASKQSELPLETWTSAQNRRKKAVELWRKKGGIVRAIQLTPKRRRAIAKKAAKSRWRNWRAMKAEKRRRAKGGLIVT
jgi:hypothetical protein